VGGGAAYSKSFINFDSRIMDFVRQIPGLETAQNDYDVSSFLGYLGTGFDLQLTKSVAIGAGVKYYTVLTARQNQSLTGAAFGTYYYNAYANPVVMDEAVRKQVLGGSLARENFYTIMGNVTFSF
jgi:hypothetical protein